MEKEKQISISPYGTLYINDKEDVILITNKAKTIILPKDCLEEVAEALKQYAKK
jgi:ribosomal protein L30E